MRKLIGIFVVIIIAVIVGAGVYRYFSYTIYYMPIGLNTSSIISKTEIESNGVRAVGWSWAIRELISSCMNAPTRPATIEDYNLLRIEIIQNNGGKVLFITQDRKVVSVDDGIVYNVDYGNVESAVESVVGFCEIKKSFKIKNAVPNNPVRVH